MFDSVSSLVSFASSRRLRPLFRVGALLVAMGSLVPAAHAQIVNVDATISGCDGDHCNGNHPAVGSFVSTVISPVQLTLDTGSYSITNAWNSLGALYDAWRYNGGSQSWTWSFMVIDDATREVLVDACCGGGPFDEAAAASQPFAVSYGTTLTLGHSTKLDFVIEDSGLFDNAGGLSVLVAPTDAPPIPSAVPEPSTWALMLSGIAVVAWARSLRRTGGST